jgi:zinc/manganese transport system substrate-binding protein
MSRRLATAAAFLALIGAASCAEDLAGEPGPVVIATTTIVGDLVHNVAGDAAHVEVLMPIGADPHEFQASARQGARVRAADLVVTSGLGLEEGLRDVIDAAAGEGVEVLELGPALDPLPLEAPGAHAGMRPRATGGLDPHWWLDPVRAQGAVRLVAARLEALWAGGGWQQRADRYVSQLQALDEDVRALVVTVPAGRRKLVTLHSALGYFAARYELTVVGVVVPGGSTDAQPSARQIAQLAALIRTEEVPAVFGETTLPTRLVDSLAREVGTGVQVVPLYTGSLGEPDSVAGTYLGMIATNAQRIVEALG